MSSVMRLLLPAIVVIVILNVCMSFYSLKKVGMPVQAKMNIGMMQSETPLETLADYPKVWPPLFPLTLWVIHAITDLDPYSINIAFFALVLFLVALYTRTYIDKRFFYVPAGLLALNTSMYMNAGVITSETMMIMECLLLMLLLARHTVEPKYSTVVLLGLLTGAICLTRYFGLIWVFPTTVLCLFLGSESIRNKLRFIVVYGLTSFLISAAWVGHVLLTTGHLTGMDRTGPRESLTDGMAMLVRLNDFQHNVTGTLKSATYDLLSPYHNGNYKTVLFSEMTVYETALAVALLLVFALTIVHLAIMIRTWSVFEKFDPKYIPAIFTVSFIFLTILVWTAGNNDPIFTRFIFPVYPVFLMAVYTLYTDINSGSVRLAFVRPFIILLSLLYVNNQLLEYSNVLAASS